MKTIFRKIGGRIIPISGKRVAFYQERIDAIKKVREFVKKRNELKKTSQTIAKLERGGIDVEFGDRVGDKFVKQFKVFKSDHAIIERSGKDIYLEKKGLGPKTIYVKTSKAKYAVQDFIHNMNRSVLLKAERIKDHLPATIRRMAKAEVRFGKRVIKDVDNAEKIAKMDMVKLDDFATINSGWKNNKIQLFDSGNIKFSSYNKLMKLAREARKNRIGKWDD